MNKLFAAVLLASSLTGFTAANAAMPLAPLSLTGNPDVIEVAGGCGPGFHRGPYGGCRPNAYRPPVVVVAPPVVVRPPVVVVRHCPPGFYRAPYGGCRAY